MKITPGRTERLRHTGRISPQSWKLPWKMWLSVPGRRPPMDIGAAGVRPGCPRSEEHTSELQSLMRISYAVFCLKKKNHHTNQRPPHNVTRTSHNAADNHTP